MINRLLSYNSSAILIFFLAFIVKVVLYYSGIDYSHSYEASIINFSTIGGLWSGFLAALFSVIIGLLILVITERYAKRTDFSLWIVLIFVLLLNFYGFYSFGPEHLGLLAFVLALLFLFHGLHVQDKRVMVIDCFNLSFILSAGALFTPHLLYLFPMFWMSRVIDGHFVLKSWIASLLAALLPFIIVDSLIFSFFSEEAELSTLYIAKQLRHTSTTLGTTPWSWTQLANIGPLILLLLSFIVTFSNVLSTKIVIRKYHRINAFIIIYLVVIMSLSLIPRHWGMMLIFVPSSYFFTHLQIYNNHKWSKVVMSVLVLSALLSYPPIMNTIINFFKVFF